MKENGESIRGEQGIDLERLDGLRTRLKWFLKSLEFPPNKPVTWDELIDSLVDMTFCDDVEKRWARVIRRNWAGDDPDEADKFRLATDRAFWIAQACQWAHGDALLCGMRFGGVSIFAFKSEDAVEEDTFKIVFLLDHPPPLNFRDYPAICESLQVRKGQGSDLLRQQDALWPKLAEVVRQWFDAVDAQWRLAVKAEAGTDPHWIDGVGQAESAGPEGDAQAPDGKAASNGVQSEQQRKPMTWQEAEALALAHCARNPWPGVNAMAKIIRDITGRTCSESTVRKARDKSAALRNRIAESGGKRTSVSDVAMPAGAMDAARQTREADPVDEAAVAELQAKHTAIDNDPLLRQLIRDADEEKRKTYLYDTPLPKLKELAELAYHDPDAGQRVRGRAR